MFKITRLRYLGGKGLICVPFVYYFVVLTSDPAVVTEKECLRSAVKKVWIDFDLGWSKYLCCNTRLTAAILATAVPEIQLNISTNKYWSKYSKKTIKCFDSECCCQTQKIWGWGVEMLCWYFCNICWLSWTVCLWRNLCPPAGLGERYVINQIFPRRGIVPQHFLHCDVVIPRDTASLHGAAVSVARLHLIEGLHSSWKTPTKTDVTAAPKPVANFWGQTETNGHSSFCFNCLRKKVWNLRGQSHAYRKPRITQKHCCVRQRPTAPHHVSRQGTLPLRWSLTWQDSRHFPIALGTMLAVTKVAGNRPRTSVRWPRSSSVFPWKYAEWISISLPMPNKCQATAWPWHSSILGRFPNTNPLIAARERAHTHIPRTLICKKKNLEIKIF